MNKIRIALIWLLTGLPIVVSGAEVNATFERLQELGQACLRYMEENNGSLPPSLATLYYQAYVHDLDYFSNPLNPDGVLERTKIDANSDYVLSHTVTDHGFPLSSTVGATAKPLIQDRSPKYSDGQGTYVFYNDGSLRLHSISGEARVVKILEAPEMRKGLSPLVKPESKSLAVEQPGRAKPEFDTSLSQPGPPQDLFKRSQELEQQLLEEYKKKEQELLKAFEERERELLQR